MKITKTEIREICMLAMEKHKIPGLTAALVQNGQITKSIALGVRDDNGDPMTEDTLFEAASLTKSLFAVWFLGLCDKGILKLDEPVVRQGAPRWSEDPCFDLVTPRQALCHGTGLPNWDDQPLPFLFTPGTSYSYSGEGYFLLQHLACETLGKTWEDWPAFMEEAFFGPWGIDTSVCWEPSIGKRMSAGFGVDGAVRKRRMAEDKKDRSPEPNSAWSLYANANIYAQFLCHLMDDHCGLSDKSFDELHRPQNHAGDGVDWGLGFGLSDGCLWHWGDNRGFKNFSIFDPETKDAVCIFTNSDLGMNCYFDILKQITDSSVFTDIENFINSAE